MTPAIGYVGGSLAGLAVILLRIDADGVEAVAWGMALNAAIATIVPAVALALRAGAERMPARPSGHGEEARAVRLRELLAGAVALRSRCRRSTSSACRSPRGATSGT